MACRPGSGSANASWPGSSFAMCLPQAQGRAGVHAEVVVAGEHEAHGAARLLCSQRGRDGDRLRPRDLAPEAASHALAHCARGNQQSAVSGLRGERSLPRVQEPGPTQS